MTEDRLAWATRRAVAVMPAVTGRRIWLPLGVACALLLGLPAPLRAGPAVDVDRALIDVGRRDLPLAERLAAVAAVLKSDATLDPAATVSAAAALLEQAPEPACWLALRGADAGWVPVRVRAALERGLEGAAAARPADDAAGRARLAACGLLVGRRSEDLASRLTAVWPPPPFVAAVLRREVGTVTDEAGRSVLEADAAGARRLLDEAAPAATLLDLATADEPDAMRKGLDGLLDLGPRAVAVLLHEARMGARGTPPGRMPRVARALLALGLLGDRRATPLLGACLASTDGWVRVAAATALGDLGDPAGAVPLAVTLCTMGDVFRPREQWEYPGTSETAVPEADWATIDYFVVDGAAADALLRLGVPRAAGFLIHEKLDPARKYFRIRVLQDAVDALRRAVPEAPVSAYNVDAGLPQRTEAFLALARWWHAQRDRDAVGARRLDENDPGFRSAARELAERLRGKDVRQFMITKPACELLGRAMTPVLIDVLGDATRGAARVELAEALALTRDPRAIDPLLALRDDERPFVRGAAAEALGAYVHGSERVRRALLAQLEDPQEAVRVSAMKALVAAPPAPDVRAAVEARMKADRQAGRARSPTLLMAERVVRLVQEGEAHWPAVAEGLASPHRFTREGWWVLLRRALDLPAWMHDASAAPEAPHVRRLDPAEALAALRARRGR